MFKFHAADLTRLIGDAEVATSSVLAERVAKRGTTPAHARQLIKRLYDEAGLWRSSRLALAHDERIFARKTFFGNYGFLEAVASILRGSSRHGMARCLTALSAEDVLHEVRAQKLLAAPLSDKGSSPSIAAEREALEELGVTIVKAIAGYEYLVSAKRAAGGDTEELAHIAAAHVRVEQLLARVLTDVHRKQNMLTWNRVDVATADQAYAEFNDQVFSATGYSYLDPVVRWDKGTPIGCPVVYDVYPGGVMWTMFGR